MAIDTENKRRSVQAYNLGAMLPVADGVIDANDRAMLTWLYAGLFSPPDGGGSEYIMFARHRNRR